MTFYKTLNGLQATNGGDHRYPGVGRWTRHLDPDQLQPCRYGYHLAKDGQLLDWLAPTVYEAEPCPDHPPVDAGGKWVTCRVRLVRRCVWDDRVARLFAADVAESALLGERALGREPDRRSWAAVDVARRFAIGEADAAERDAARDAAWDAARDAAGAAARDAAWAAAGAAAWDAAGDAAGAAARDAARDAAGAAARDAAWAAAGAAAWAAARDAARAAAWAAARDAARDAIYRRLTIYLAGDTPGPVQPLYGGEAA
jgi:hypothetical protein